MCHCRGQGFGVQRCVPLSGKAQQRSAHHSMAPGHHSHSCTCRAGCTEARQHAQAASSLHKPQTDQCWGQGQGCRTGRGTSNAEEASDDACPGAQGRVRPAGVRGPPYLVRARRPSSGLLGCLPPDLRCPRPEGGAVHSAAPALVARMRVPGAGSVPGHPGAASCCPPLARWPAPVPAVGLCGGEQQTCWRRAHWTGCTLHCERAPLWQRRQDRLVHDSSQATALTRTIISISVAGETSATLRAGQGLPGSHRGCQLRCPGGTAHGAHQDAPSDGHDEHRGRDDREHHSPVQRRGAPHPVLRPVRRLQRCAQPAA